MHTYIHFLLELKYYSFHDAYYTMVLLKLLLRRSTVPRGLGLHGDTTIKNKNVPTVIPSSRIGDDKPCHLMS